MYSATETRLHRDACTAYTDSTRGFRTLPKDQVEALGRAFGKAVADAINAHAKDPRLDVDDIPKVGIVGKRFAHVFASVQRVVEGTTAPYKGAAKDYMEAAHKSLVAHVDHGIRLH